MTLDDANDCASSDVGLALDTRRFEVFRDHRRAPITYASEGSRDMFESAWTGAQALMRARGESPSGLVRAAARTLRLWQGTEHGPPLEDDEF